MADITGSEILAKSLKNEGTEILFFLMGGPMLLAESSCIKEGIRPLDVRHEQSAAFMAQAYSRLLAEARRVHGGERPRHDQPHHRRRQRADRLLPGRRDRRLEPDRPERPPGFPGDRPARHHEAVHQMGRSHLQPQAHSGAGERRFPEGDERQAGPGLSRFPRRYSLRQDSRRTGRLEPVRPAAARRAAARRSQQGRCPGRRDRQGAPADHPVRQRRDLVAGLAGTAGVRRKDRHSILHHAAGPRRPAGRS